LRAVTVLIVPGLGGSGPEHWQTRWEAERSDCSRVEQLSWHDPDPASWSAVLDAAIAAVAGPVILVAHSLGCVAVAHWAAHLAIRGTGPARAGGALLVAPCDVERPGALAAIARFAPTPRVALPFPSTVVASADDALATLPVARGLAHSWGSDFVDAGALGHINAASGLEAWDFGQALLDALIAGAAYYRAGSVCLNSPARLPVGTPAGFMPLREAVG
jgi:predicted alpha/beta hydrolase family esterase